MKLSKAEAAAHTKAEAILKQDTLSYEDKIFVLDNWHEGAEHMNGLHGAFFTPMGLARDFSIELSEESTVDLCAGIGMLAFAAVHYKGVQEITCIEWNPKYVEVGRKVVPEATWICGSILDTDIIGRLPHFRQAISNPPFGNIPKAKDRVRLQYTGSDFEFITIEVASKIASTGTFILPQMSTPFKYSGNRNMDTMESPKYDKFREQTGFVMDFNCGIDTEQYLGDWRGVKPLCEIVHIDFTAQGRLFLQTEMRFETQPT